jgi:hypothetical protein
VHHEIDHLNGVLFIDRVERLDDLYRVSLDDNGKPVRMLISQIVRPRRKADCILDLAD